MLSHFDNMLERVVKIWKNLKFSQNLATGAIFTLKSCLIMCGKSLFSGPKKCENLAPK
jgi:hypothetical protein